MHIKLPSISETIIAQGLQMNLGLRSRVLTVTPSSQNSKRKILLKMESELPYGSYKMRGVSTAMDLYTKTYTKSPTQLLTISAGNMAQAVAATARSLRIPSFAIVPQSAPKIKTDSVSALGAKLIPMAMKDVWDLIENPKTDTNSFLIHPLVTPGILAGYGVIALEILMHSEKPDAVFIPFGVGGLTLGVAHILKQLSPQTQVVCVETEAAPTLTSALSSGGPVYIKKKETCADAIGTPRVVQRVYELVKNLSLVDQVVVVSEEQVLSAMEKLYLKYDVVAEGAAAACYAAASESNYETSVAILTGQNIDLKNQKDLLYKKTCPRSIMA